MTNQKELSIHRAQLFLIVSSIKNYLTSKVVFCDPIWMVYVPLGK